MLRLHKIKQFFLLVPSREIVMGLEGSFMGFDYGRWNFWTFHNFLQGLFCWKDACQQRTVQNIMGSRGWKKSKDC